MIRDRRMTSSFEIHGGEGQGGMINDASRTVVCFADTCIASMTKRLLSHDALGGHRHPFSFVPFLALEIAITVLKHV